MPDRAPTAELEIEIAYLPQAVPAELLKGTPTRIIDS